MSKQREVIYGIVASTMTHPTADWIYQQARMQMPNISLGTVYRNLKSLCQEGRLLEINTTKSPSRYDANVSHHSHLRCTNCDKLEDVTEKEMSFPVRTKKLHGFRVFEFRLEMMGLCPECQKSVVN